MTHKQFNVCLVSVCALSLCISHQWVKRTGHTRRDPPAGDFGLCSSSSAPTHATPTLIRAPPLYLEPNYATSDFWGQVAFLPVPRFHINTHDPVGQDIYISKSVHDAKQPWDPFLWQLMVDVLAGAQSNLMVDVGANLGYFSLQAAALGHRVVAFEPMSRNANKFISSIVQNKFEQNITLYQNAVTYQSGRVVALRETHPTNQGNGKISPMAASKTGRYGVDYVETVSLDDVLHEDVLLMKIDVEGFEGAVLNGAKRLICWNIVRYIALEFSSDTIGSADCPASPLLNRFEALGYSISDIVSGSPRLNAEAYAHFPPNILLTLIEFDTPPGFSHPQWCR
jgi:FkbM family methyltransferase